MILKTRTFRISNLEWSILKADCKKLGVSVSDVIRRGARAEVRRMQEVNDASRETVADTGADKQGGLSVLDQPEVKEAQTEINRCHQLAQEALQRSYRPPAVGNGGGAGVLTDPDVV